MFTVAAVGDDKLTPWEVFLLNHNYEHSIYI